MEFELLGQLRGPECKRVMKQSIVIRRLLERWFGSIANDCIQKLCIVIRVNGSLGSFGMPGIENIHVDKGVLSCDLVIADHNWDALSDEQIAGVLRQQIAPAIKACLRTQEVAYSVGELTNAMLPST